MNWANPLAPPPKPERKSGPKVATRSHHMASRKGRLIAMYQYEGYGRPPKS
jgi:hypothetical protein